MQAKLVLLAPDGSRDQHSSGAIAIRRRFDPVTVRQFCPRRKRPLLRQLVKEGGFGKFYHRREPAPLDQQTVIRLNRDTLYSGAVFDLDAGPVTITLPDAGKRFMSMQVIDEDQYTPTVVYGAGSHTLTQGESARATSRRHPHAGRSGDPKDVQQVHALQDAIKVEPARQAGKFEVPNWDPASQKKVRDALLVLASTLPDQRDVRHQEQGRSGAPPHRRRSAWGGNPDKDAHLSQRRAAKERRQDCLPARRQGRAGRWLLVDQRLQRQGLLRAEPATTPTRSTTSPRRRATTVQYGRAYSTCAGAGEMGQCGGAGGMSGA